MKMQAREPRAWTMDLDIEAYHHDKTHDSSSSLKLFRNSPAEYYERRVLCRIDDKQTNSQRLGTLDHILTIHSPTDWKPCIVCAGRKARAGR